jgi:hypothetical protein
MNLLLDDLETVILAIAGQGGWLGVLEDCFPFLSHIIITTQFNLYSQAAIALSDILISPSPKPNLKPNLNAKQQAPEIGVPRETGIPSYSTNQHIQEFINETANEELMDAIRGYDCSGFGTILAQCFRSTGGAGVSGK